MRWSCIFLGDKLHYVMGKTVCGREVETEICILKFILFYHIVPKRVSEHFKESYIFHPY
jgi:hypothetical protein